MHKHTDIKRCSSCGLRLSEFQETGMLGCPDCYVHFASLLGPLLKKIHGSNQHVGKTYRKTVRPLPPTQELSKLKLELHDAIAKEEFELAAQVRDQIRALERQMLSHNKENRSR